MKDTLVSLMDEIRKSLQVIESDLPRLIDGWVLSQLSKLPFKVLVYRGALTWRMAELSRAAFEEFQGDRLASAIVLTRAAVETGAALWYLCAKLEESVGASEIGDIDDYLMKLIVGIATDPPADANTGEALVPRPIKVGKFLDSVERDLEGFKCQYGYLSEYAHPNWAGTVYLYSEFDKKNATASFGPNIRSTESANLTGVTNLNVALLMFERSRSRIAQLLPGFTKLCESRLEDSGAANDAPSENDAMRP